MIKIKDSENCCGCSACSIRCPKQCITMQEDNEGFLYPIVNEIACVDCGLCEKVCHELHPYSKKDPIYVYAAVNKDEQIRFSSSSGGIFFLLAKEIIEKGGVVFGARFDEKWQVRISYTEVIDDLKYFIGSKYVQSQIKDSYKEAEAYLRTGRDVLFAGTPCQIAGLKHFLRKDYENLVTVDFACHGVPSPKVWALYLNEIQKEAVHAIRSIEFRCERNGWKRFNSTLLYDAHSNEVSITSLPTENQYMKAFISNLTLRPSCFKCQAKEGRSHSDITLGDYWGIRKEHKGMDDGKGTSFVFINTLKGERLVNWKLLHFVESSYEQVVRHNLSIIHSARPHVKRREFFNNIDNAQSVNNLLSLMLKPSFKELIKENLRWCKKNLLHILNIVTGHQSHKILPYMRPITINTENLQIAKVSFRDKGLGWLHYRLTISLYAKSQSNK